MGFLQFYKLTIRAEVIAEMQIARRWSLKKPVSRMPLSASKEYRALAPRFANRRLRVQVDARPNRASRPTAA